MDHEMDTVLQWQGKEDEEENDEAIERGVKTKPGEENNFKILHESLNEVTDKMKKNMENILQREERLENLNDLSRELEGSASHFKFTSKNVAETYKKKNIKTVAAIATVVVLIVVAIIIVIVLFATGVIPPPKIP